MLVKLTLRYCSCCRLNIDFSVLNIAWNKRLIFILVWRIAISVYSTLLKLIVLLRMLLLIKIFFNFQIRSSFKCSTFINIQSLAFLSLKPLIRFFFLNYDILSLPIFLLKVKPLFNNERSRFWSLRVTLLCYLLRANCISIARYDRWFSSITFSFK